MTLNFKITTIDKRTEGLARIVNFQKDIFLGIEWLGEWQGPVGTGSAIQ